MAEFGSGEKKPFSSCVQGVEDDILKEPVCLESYGEPSIQPEAEWILSQCAERDTLRSDDFGYSIGLSRDEVSAAIRAAPRSKEQQVRQVVLAWSKGKGGEATYERLLEALYIKDEVELVEDICQRLSQVKISDERRIYPSGEEVLNMPNAIQVQPVPHKAAHEERLMSQSSVEPENSTPFLPPVRVSSSEALRPNLPLPSSPKESMVNPISATEQSGLGEKHSAIAWSTSHFIPDSLLHDKSKLHTSSTTGSGSVQVEDGELKYSLAVQGETSSSKLALEARMDEMERKMKEMGEELRREDAKMKEEIEDLKRELRERDSEILRLREELNLETEQKQKAERQLVSERENRQIAEASSDELQKQVEELNRQLRKKDIEIQVLKRKKRARDSFEEVDHLEDNTGCHEDEDEVNGQCADTSNLVLSDEELSPVLKWKLEDPEKVLGCGNFGIVFKGHCEDTGRELAVKVVRDINDVKTVKSLEQEYNTLSKLRHKRIVSYLGVTYEPHPTQGKKCLFVMTEFMPGGTLAEYYAKQGSLNETLTRRYTRQIVQGVAYLHQRSIIHRDLKGSNIMRDTRGHIKLADFGSAKEIFADTSEKRTSYLYGTAPWAAPEVLRSETAHCKSDIWSVAATVAEMMTAERPYKSNSEIKDNNAIVYMVGKDMLNPLQSVSMKKLIDDGAVSQDAITFLKECFKSAVGERPSASDLLSAFSFCQKW